MPFSAEFLWKKAFFLFQQLALMAEFVRDMPFDPGKDSDAERKSVPLRGAVGFP